MANWPSLSQRGYCEMIFLTTFLQIRFATIDLELHTKYIPSGSESVYDIDKRVGEKTQVIPPLPEDRFLCSFSHIFAGKYLWGWVRIGQLSVLYYISYISALPSGGYAAGYYSYKVVFFIFFCYPWSWFLFLVLFQTVLQTFLMQLDVWAPQWRCWYIASECWSSKFCCQRLSTSV